VTAVAGDEDAAAVVERNGGRDSTGSRSSSKPARRPGIRIPGRRCAGERDAADRSALAAWAKSSISFESHEPLTKR
jgi:hypothetical protein